MAALLAPNQTFDIETPTLHVSVHQNDHGTYIIEIEGRKGPSHFFFFGAISGITFRHNEFYYSIEFKFRDIDKSYNLNIFEAGYIFAIGVRVGIENIDEDAVHTNSEINITQDEYNQIVGNPQFQALFQAPAPAAIVAPAPAHVGNNDPINPPSLPNPDPSNRRRKTRRQKQQRRRKSRN